MANTLENKATPPRQTKQKTPSKSDITKWKTAQEDKPIEVCGY